MRRDLFIVFVRCAITGPEKLCYVCRVHIYDQKWHVFKVKITKYQLKKQIGPVFYKSCQYNILGTL